MDCRKLITKNLRKYKHKAHIKNNYIYINLGEHSLQYQQLQDIISTLSFSLFTKNIQNVVFIASNIEFEDKLTYILFECLIYTIIKDYKKNVFFSYKKHTKNITVAGIEHSLLCKLMEGKITIKSFVNKFGELQLTQEHFRAIVKNDVDKDYFSKLYTNIHGFLEYAIIYVESVQKTKLDRKYIDKVAEIIVELATNANEHTKEDCLIDVDISPNWKRADSDESVVAINLVVVDFSKILMGDNLRTKIENFEALNLNEIVYDKYRAVKSAYKYHSNYFNDNYTEEDFFNIASFQKQVSSRTDKVTGGTGLPRMLQVLLEQTELDICYMISGDRVLHFTLDNLQFKDDWVGFNKSHDFTSDIPDIDAISHSSLFLPGCAFNLNLVIKPEV